MNKLCSSSIILVDKPAGITSFDVIKKLRVFTGIRRIGHAGVLDKPASGLLICATERATKLLSLFENQYKIYKTDIRLGIKTDTYDISGRVVVEKSVRNITQLEIESVMDEFVGEIEQSVPLYSNVRLNGKKLYRYALEKDNVTPPKRKVVIHRIDIIEYKDSILSITVTCSKGTYIRSLANDIGEKLGVYGCVQSLRRIFSYPFSIEAAGSLDSIKCIPIDSALKFLPSLKIGDRFISKVLDGFEPGRIFDINMLKNGIYRVVDKSDRVVALIERKDSKVLYRFISLDI